MQKWSLEGRHDEWAVLGETGRTQAALMTIPAGESEGGPENRHASSDQWLYVIDGSGEAIVEGKGTALKQGDLIVIVAGEAHEIRAGKDGPLKTVNVYGPPVDFDEE